MVYLGVYDSIFYFLEEQDIVDNVINYSEGILEPLMQKVKTNEFYNEFILEFALFNYIHENKMLIEFLLERLYPSLDKNEKKEFKLIEESERYNLRFVKKVRINKLDTKGKDLYDFSFRDVDTGEIKIIVSSSSLDDNKMVINARLIDNPNHEGKYSIIGGILDKKTYEAVSGLSSIKFMMKRIDDAKKEAEGILKFSKDHSLKEIDEYNNKLSKFPKQDREIMRINRLFFEKFGLGFDDFFKDFFILSNDNLKFIEMAEYYISISEELNDTIMDTNYLFGLTLLTESDSIRAFAAFIKKDFKSFEEGIAELRKEGKKEFKNEIISMISLSREKIMENQKIFINEQIAPLNLKGYGSFFNKIDGYSPEQIDKFLQDVADYLDINYKDINVEGIEISISLIKELLNIPNRIPYLDEVEEAQKGKEYDPERFYDYIDVGEDVHSLFIFLASVFYVYKKEYGQAYALIKKEKIRKTESFDEMFLTGKIFSFFEDDEYKPYFNKAKGINKVRYRLELDRFLKEKEQKVLSLQ